MISDAIDAELARRRLINFAFRMSPGFKDAAHSRFICNLFEGIEAGRTERVFLSAPPGFGKSTTAQLLVAWAIGRDPTLKVLMLSASDDLARRNSRAVRDILTSDRWPFPDVKLAPDSTSVERWNTTAGGGLLAKGEGSMITGFRGRMIVCDDLQADELSPGTRDTLERWFRGVMTTRLDPGGVLFGIQTRWSTDDIIARLANGDSGDQWTFVNLPALAGEHDPYLGRAFGESLWPEMWPTTLLAKRKAEVGSHVFSSQYMGEPTPEGGRIFDPSWFSERYHQSIPIPGHDPNAITVTALDAAMKENIGGSYSALCSVRVSHGKVYVLEVERERAGMQRLLKMIEAHCERNDTHTLVVEDAAMGSAVVDIVKGSVPYNVIAVKPIDSKEVRAMSIVPTCESQMVILPHQARWLADFENELRDFPGGSSSDQNDAFVWAVQYAWTLYTREMRWQQTLESADRLRAQHFGGSYTI